MLVVSSTPVTDSAYACDAFGYLRSAQLFNTNGFLGGFDTRVKNEEAQFLIRTANSIGLAPDDFSQMIAPHSFHYCPASDHVIHQYPPGAGLLMSLFHRGRKTQWMIVLVMAMVVVPFLFVAAKHRLRAVEVFAFIAIILAAEQLMLDTLESHSVPLTIGLIPLTALAALRTMSGGPAVRWTSGALVGLLSGLLLITRIPNVFVVAGVICFLLLRVCLEERSNLRSSLGPVALALVVFLLCGVFPLLAFDRINAGHFIASTYAPADASPPHIAWRLIKDNLTYYFGGSFAWRIAFASLLVVVCAIVAAVSTRNRTRRLVLTAAAPAALLTFVVSLAYFCTHEIRTPYYVAPGCFFALVLGVLAFTERPYRPKWHDPMDLWRVAVALFLLAACVEFELRHFHPDVIKPLAPPELTDARSIVWSDLTSGTLLYYNGKYAAKLAFASSCTQDRMIQAISDAGRAQYFIADSPSVQSIINRLSSEADLQVIGTYQFFGASSIYKLVSLRKKLIC
jgi:hypothetical protein